MGKRAAAHTYIPKRKIGNSNKKIKWKKERWAISDTSRTFIGFVRRTLKNELMDIYL